MGDVVRLQDQKLMYSTDALLIRCESFLILEIFFFGETHRWEINGNQHLHPLMMQIVFIIKEVFGFTDGMGQVLTFG